MGYRPERCPCDAGHQRFLHPSDVGTGIGIRKPSLREAYRPDNARAAVLLQMLGALWGQKRLGSGHVLFRDGRGSEVCEDVRGVSRRLFRRGGHRPQSGQLPLRRGHGLPAVGGHRHRQLCLYTRVDSVGSSQTAGHGRRPRSEADGPHQLPQGPHGHGSGGEGRTSDGRRPVPQQEGIVQDRRQDDRILVPLCLSAFGPARKGGEGEDNEYRPQRPSLRYHALGIRGDLYREGLGYGVRRVLGPHPRPHRWILGEGRLGGHRRYRLRCGSNPCGDMRLLGITRRPGGPGGLEGCRGEADVRHGGGKGRVCRFLDLGFRRGMAG